MCYFEFRLYIINCPRDVINFRNPERFSGVGLVSATLVQRLIRHFRSQVINMRRGRHYQKQINTRTSTIKENNHPDSSILCFVIIFEQRRRKYVICVYFYRLILFYSQTVFSHTCTTGFQRIALVEHSNPLCITKHMLGLQVIGQIFL